MIKPKKMNSVILAVRDIAKSLAWYADEAKDICIRLFALEITQQELERAEKEFPEEADLVRVDHPKYKSCIIEDPDGHSIELYVDKIV